MRETEKVFRDKYKVWKEGKGMVAEVEVYERKYWWRGK